MANGADATSPPLRPPRYSIALLSLCALAYEVLLMRLFSIMQWHHFAYMIISLALLGYGVSGTALALTQQRLLPRFPAAFVTSVTAFGASTLICFLAAGQLPFNAEAVLWDPRQALYLAGMYLLLALPFFFGASAIALAFARFHGASNRIYAADLLGAGAGSLGILGLLAAVFPGDALDLVSALGLATAAVAWWELGLRPRKAALAFLVVAVLPPLLPGSWTTPVMSPYKGLPELLQVAGTRVVARRSSPLGLIAVAASPEVPLRYAPGLSLNADTEPPAQLALFTDGDGLSAITRFSGDLHRLRYLDQLTSAAAFHLVHPEAVLVLGAGGGADVLQALARHAARVDAVELNPQVVDLVRNRFGAFSGHLYDRPDVHVHIADARGFVAATRRHYGLIQLGLLDSFGASASGLYALNESYLYTVEAMQQYLGRLSPGGLLSITRWVKLPPRDTLKLFATAVEALRRQGVTDPGRRMVLLRGWQTSTLLIGAGPFTPAQIAALETFCRQRSFDVAWFPGMTRDQANRYNVLPQPYFYDGARALLGPAAGDYLARYKFDLRPATDDRPYFFHFFRWSALPEIMALRQRGGMPLLEWGYLVLVATLAQAAAASAVLILLPLFFERRRRSSAVRGRARVLAYFSALGLGFLFVEVVFIQKFILFLHHPLYAAATVLAAFLVFAGLGSHWARHVHEGRRSVAAAVGGIALLTLLYRLGLGPVFDALGGLAQSLKIAAAAALVAPLAFCMGMPFPLGMAALGRTAPEWIPWAWAVNGCASVLSAVLATLLAVHLGFNAVVVLAIALYLLAALTFPGRTHRRDAGSGSRN